MVKITWWQDGFPNNISGLPKGKLIKTIEMEWQGKAIKEIWQEAKTLLSIPETSVITLQAVSGKVVNGNYILQDKDELTLTTATIPKPLLEKLSTDKIL